uniref:Uncharacterized protein n=1 Tax=Setaria viridis TaxID=4556 RepID=A0A4V6D4C9_SETVI|nr:hypothetical protein SEVIR_7G191050v2 [Setaria viridis]
MDGDGDPPPPNPVIPSLSPPTGSILSSAHAAQRQLALGHGGLDGLGSRGVERRRAHARVPLQQGAAPREGPHHHHAHAARRQGPQPLEARQELICESVHRFGFSAILGSEQKLMQPSPTCRMMWLLFNSKEFLLNNGAVKLNSVLDKHEIGEQQINFFGLVSDTVICQSVVIHGIHHN